MSVRKYLSARARIVWEPLICGANHLNGSCMVRVFAGGCFWADFVNIDFMIGLVLMSQDCRRVQMFSFLSIHADR